MIPINKGEITFPNKIPNLNHSLFNGASKPGLNNAKSKKTKEIIKDQIINFLPYING